MTVRRDLKQTLISRWQTADIIILNVVSLYRDDSAFFKLHSAWRKKKILVIFNQIATSVCPAVAWLLFISFIRVTWDWLTAVINSCLSLCCSSIGKGRRPMSKLVYNLLSTAELKRRLKECHLSVQGSRDQMIKRHKEFVHVYNAQCDSLNPKSGEDTVINTE